MTIFPFHQRSSVTSPMIGVVMLLESTVFTSWHLTRRNAGA